MTTPGPDEETKEAEISTSPSDEECKDGDLDTAEGTLD
ncbi:hypothetical protein PC129_g21518 [Phytophthora cactorum]|uniref:Uncharacterized protein n=1 Tax=Phytophthora cactorum TaxID=29920 RepID=A0A8T1AZA4_9STRA|nr:hypothetical protein Pcac1_g8610 [Phytophthora cactorum]KAG2875587.1 hypothetical protein PC114_g24633 [Phytophthora cactorum]KAG2890567.1 hypothetical protein PC117_g24439 [Phytophthora cactorum]KAG2963663.1 hypothetical protein PC119_g25443 [Phytophthora cactorum]KAG2978803.1 hypothetical protein PC120_g25245 [Phytophthora cactorum]